MGYICKGYLVRPISFFLKFLIHLFVFVGHNECADAYHKIENEEYRAQYLEQCAWHKQSYQ